MTGCLSISFEYRYGRNRVLTLSIETSCDETAAAVVRDGRELLGNVISSQVAIHAEYGGVVPEIASRKHLEAVVPVIKGALAEAGVTLDDIEGVVATRGPGLVGALLVGLSTAKGIAFVRKLPFVGVHHIEGHLLAGFLEKPASFPFLALVVSGGHTHLYRVDGFGRYRQLGQTLDDAAGEAFDKTATLLGLGYPGGMVIDRLAGEGDPKRYPLPRPLLHDGSCNFSFSGLKTAVATIVRREGGPVKEGQPLRDLCASFQAAVVDVLTAKTAAAFEAEGLTRLVVAGGVACNSGLRGGMARLSERNGVELYIPSPALCADNAAMIAVPGDFYLEHGITDDLTLDAVASWPLPTVTTQRWGA
jgi:N6-L-threonylcarbamoyladenine synthase